MYNNLTGDKGDNKSEETRETGQVKKFINCLNFWVITMQTKIRNAVLEPKGEMWILLFLSRHTTSDILLHFISFDGEF